jgi:diguanylate cyclase (GGDEF)-like protein/PAS domain S-box-containing protein
VFQVAGEDRAASEGREFYKQILDNASEGIYFVDRDRRITYWNRGAERISGYAASEVVGMRCADNVLMHVNAAGERLCGLDTCPAARSMRGNEPCELELYLHHKDGHRVPVVTRVTPIAEPGGEVVGAVEVFNDNTVQVEARQRLEELEREALLDELTGLGNRRHAEIHIEARIDQLKRYSWPFGLLYFDIDRFKDVNDAYGHAVGDRVLRMVARTAQGSVRTFDQVSRWGGEEFVAIVENVREPQLGKIAEKLRRLIEQSSLTGDGLNIAVTVSVGATPGKPDDSVESLVERADHLMYLSKQAGRNRLTLS